MLVCSALLHRVMPSPCNSCVLSYMFVLHSRIDVSVTSVQVSQARRMAGSILLWPCLLCGDVRSEGIPSSLCSCRVQSTAVTNSPTRLSDVMLSPARCAALGGASRRRPMPDNGVTSLVSAVSSRHCDAVLRFRGGGAHVPRGRTT